MAVGAGPGQPTFPLRQPQTTGRRGSSPPPPHPPPLHPADLSAGRRSRLLPRDVARPPLLGPERPRRDLDLRSAGSARCPPRVTGVDGERRASAGQSTLPVSLPRFCRRCLRFANGGSTDEKGRRVSDDYLLLSQLLRRMPFRDRSKSHARTPRAVHGVLTLLLWCQTVLQSVLLAAATNPRRASCPDPVCADIFLGRCFEPVLNLLIHSRNIPLRIWQPSKLVLLQPRPCSSVFSATPHRSEHVAALLKTSAELQEPNKKASVGKLRPRILLVSETRGDCQRDRPAPVAIRSRHSQRHSGTGVFVFLPTVAAKEDCVLLLLLLLRFQARIVVVAVSRTIKASTGGLFCGVESQR